MTLEAQSAKKATTSPPIEIDADTRPRSYVYTDSFDEVVYRKVRRDRPKRFVWEIPDGKDGWTAGLSGRTRYLYRLPELIASPDRVWLPEGEKDVDTLCALGLTATTSGGATDPWLPEFDTNRSII